MGVFFSIAMEDDLFIK
jgi:hypothetical protein